MKEKKEGKTKGKKQEIRFSFFKPPVEEKNKHSSSA